MTDVIGDQQKSASAVRIFTPDQVKPRGTAKRQPYQKLSGAIGK
jgi:hypothetical protein